jgi:hypothetical protein
MKPKTGNTTVVDCPICGWRYVAGDPDDERDHARMREGALKSIDHDRQAAADQCRRLRWNIDRLRDAIASGSAAAEREQGVWTFDAEVLRKPDADTMRARFEAKYGPFTPSAPKPHAARGTTP